jgi:hypothetical protein
MGILLRRKGGSPQDERRRHLDSTAMIPRDSRRFGNAIRMLYDRALAIT